MKYSFIPSVLVIVFLLFLFSPGYVFASTRITSLDRASAQGGETITLRGTDLQLSGSESCTYYPPGSKQIVWSTCKFKARAIAMKTEPFEGCARPIAYLSIISGTSTEVIAKIPTVMQDGEGLWYISWGGVYENGEEFIVGGGELPLKITNVGRGNYDCVQKDGKVVTTTKEATPTTALPPSPTPTTSLTLSPSPTPLDKNDDISSGRYWHATASLVLNIITAPYRLLLKLFSR